MSASFFVDFGLKGTKLKVAAKKLIEAFKGKLGLSVTTKTVALVTIQELIDQPSSHVTKARQWGVPIILYDGLMDFLNHVPTAATSSFQSPQTESPTPRSDNSDTLSVCSEEVVPLVADDTPSLPTEKPLQTEAAPTWSDPIQSDTSSEFTFPVDLFDVEPDGADEPCLAQSQVEDEVTEEQQWIADQYPSFDENEQSVEEDPELVTIDPANWSDFDAASSVEWDDKAQTAPQESDVEDTSEVATPIETQPKKMKVVPDDKIYYFDPRRGLGWRKKLPERAMFRDGDFMMLPTKPKVETKPATNPRWKKKDNTELPFLYLDIASGAKSTFVKVIPPSYAGRKVFVGGIDFSDIELKSSVPILQLPSLKAAMKKKAADKKREKAKKKNRKKKAKEAKEEKAIEEGTQEIVVDLAAEKEAHMASVIAQQAQGGRRETRFKKSAKTSAPPTDAELILSIRVWSAKEVEDAKKQRQEHIKQMLTRFGPVVGYEENWDHGYLFVIYQDAQDAENAVKALADTGSRKAVIRDFKASLRTRGDDVLLAPSSKFYARWPEYFQKLTKKRKEARKEALKAAKTAKA